MKILFVIDRRVDAGSIQAVAGYVRAGDACGHEFALYGKPDPRYAGVRTATDVESFDFVLFVYESKLGWLSGLQLAHLLVRVPRERRAVLDADGMYNPLIIVDGYDRNHASETARSAWQMHCDQLADRIFQPTLEPLQPNVIPLPFYGYDPRVNGRAATSPKRFDLLHVGHNWWRWREVSGQLLPAIGAIRNQLGRIAFIGAWWDATPAWAASLGLQQAFQVDPTWFGRLGIEVHPPVPFSEVVATMSTSRINLMTQRPLFRRLGILTSKYFEIFCGDTIPFVLLDPAQAERVYGPAGRALALGDSIGDQILHALKDPDRYWEIVQEVRRHLAREHSYQRRVEQLVDVLCGGISRNEGREGRQ